MKKWWIQNERMESGDAINWENDNELLWNDFYDHLNYIL